MVYRAKDLAKLVDDRIEYQLWLECDALRSNAAYSLGKEHRISHYLEVEAAKHSADMETPSNGKKIHRGRVVERMKQNLLAAQSYFTERYSGTIEDKLLIETVEIIEPSQIPAYYRGQNDPTTFAQGVNRVYPRNVASQMEQFIKENSALTTHIDKAIHAHLHIARIHPFKDGNGRLARLVQNSILSKGNFPPIIIEKFDRPEYIKLINAAQCAYELNNHKDNSDVSTFYDYLALKLRDSVKKIKRNIVA